MRGKTANKVKTEPSPEGRLDWMSRLAVAERLGDSVTNVRNLVRTGQLTEHKDPITKRPIYRTADVDAYMLRRPARRASSGGRRKADPRAEAGAVAARAYTLIADGGADRRRLVRELAIPPALADELFDAFHRQGETFTISHVAAAELARELKVEPITSEAGLAAAIKRVLTRIDSERRQKLEEKDAFIQKLEGRIERLEREAETLKERTAKAEGDARKARAAEQSARTAAETIGKIIERAAAVAAPATTVPAEDSPQDPPPAPATARAEPEAP